MPELMNPYEVGVGIALALLAMERIFALVRPLIKNGRASKQRTSGELAPAEWEQRFTHIVAGEMHPFSAQLSEIAEVNRRVEQQITKLVVLAETFASRLMK